jgi:hypothetical protein
MHDYPLQQHQQYLGRQTIPFSVPPEFHPHTVGEQQVGMHMIYRTASIPRQAYYVTEQSNPGIATMTTNPVPPQYRLAQQQIERPPIEMPYSTPGMAASIQSSPSAFSAASVQSLLMQDGGFYPPQQQHPPAYTQAGHQFNSINLASPLSCVDSLLIIWPVELNHCISKSD